MHHQYDCEHKMHILLIFLLTQYISGTQKILNKENIGKLGQISSNLGNLLPILKKPGKLGNVGPLGGLYLFISFIYLVDTAL